MNATLQVGARGKLNIRWHKLVKSLSVAVGLLYLAGCSSSPSAVNGDVNKVEAAKTRVSLGLTYLKNGNYTQAKANLDKALKFAPGLVDTHFALAYYYQSVDEPRLAEQYYQQALRLDDENADLLNSYGAFLCTQGSYALAERYLLQAINSQQYSHTAGSYENLAICSQAQAKISQAIDYLKTALSHEPGRVKSAFLLLEMTVSAQRWQDAKDALQRFEKLAPVSARSLEYAIAIEQGLGNQDVADGYRDMLQRLYPQYKPSSLVDVVEESSKGIENATTMNNDELEKPTLSDRIHVVQPGENLYRISLKYNVRMQRLIEWNGLRTDSQIKVGTRLIVSDPNAK